MIEIEARLDELEQLGLGRRARLVSGPQGPRVVLDGKPALLLCSNNYLGLADHPAVREAAADAAMRWGVGAGGSRLASGTMTIHRRLEERLAAFQRRQAALLFGSGYLASLGVIGALARRGDVVFSDELNHPSVVDGCRLSHADVFVYRHGDVEHLEWGLSEAEGRGALIVTDGVFAGDGAVAPLPELAELAHRYDVRLVVDEAHGTGVLGPGGRGAVADAGVEDGVDVIVGTLGKALGAYGAYVACDARMAKYLLHASRSLIYSTAPPPPAVAGALAALSLLEEQPRRVDKLQANAALLRAELARQGFDVAASTMPIVPLDFGAAEDAQRVCEKALERGVFGQAIRPPAVPAGSSRLRLAVMASHSKSELRNAAQALATAVRSAGLRPEELVPVEFDEDELAPALAVAPPLAFEADPARSPLWDDGDDELWVERRRSPAKARASATAGGGRPFDAELDEPRGSGDRLPAGIFDAESGGSFERAVA
jgi:8-amino-7-oxononanoate synthase